MSSIGAAALFPRDVSASLFTGPSDALPASAIPSQASSGSSWGASSGPSWGASRGHHHQRDPATRIDLSDKVKDILARASTDQDVADRLKAFIESIRGDGSAQDPSPSDASSSPDINQAFEQLTQGIAAADDTQDPDGVSSGFSSREANLAVQAYRRGNKEYITFSESEIAATSVSASSDAGSVSATSAATHTASLTFAIDFRTGAISIAASESTSVSTAVQIQQPASSFSTFA
jgi:hypothetical protein